jgi:hypothetical protein
MQRLAIVRPLRARTRRPHSSLRPRPEQLQQAAGRFFRQAQLGGASARASVPSAASCQTPPLQRPRHRTRTTHCPLRCGSHVHTKRRPPGRASAHLRRLPSKRTVRSLRRFVLSSSEYEIEVTVQPPAQTNHVIVKRLENSAGRGSAWRSGLRLAASTQKAGIRMVTGPSLMTRRCSSSS